MRAKRLPYARFSTNIAFHGEAKKVDLLEIAAVRILVIFIFGVCGYAVRPFGVNGIAAIAAGCALGSLVVAIEWRVIRMGVERVRGAAVGLLVGALIAFVSGAALTLHRPASGAVAEFAPMLLLLIFGYVGTAVGARKGELLSVGSRPSKAHESDNELPLKILDTSVIIDGRIADVAETGFLDGVLLVPQFVLRELQLVADSSDSAKRNRGRRGLDILQRIQKMAQVSVRIVEDDFPAVREVDLKLIELAKMNNGKIVTNDFNLNKVAQLRGVEVLNINELANSLRPVVLPGETMRVFILKEGKEYGQGVAYLDDGTMVVVDNARRMISKTIDVTVTSVLQTTAGKMIFGKHDERVQVVTPERSARREQAAGADA